MLHLEFTDDGMASLLSCNRRQFAAFVAENGIRRTGIDEPFGLRDVLACVVALKVRRWAGGLKDKVGQADPHTTDLVRSAVGLVYRWAWNSDACVLRVSDGQAWTCCPFQLSDSDWESEPLAIDLHENLEALEVRLHRGT